MFNVWEKTRDSKFLAELIRVDLKLKTESKQIRNLKLDQDWVNQTKNQVSSAAEKQLVAFGKLKMFGVYPKAVLSSLTKPDSLLKALTFLTKQDLQKVECIPFLSLNIQNPLIDQVLNQVGIHDNQCVFMLSKQPQLVKGVDQFGQVVEELVKFYLAQQTEQVGQILVNLLGVRKSDIASINRVMDILI